MLSQDTFWWKFDIFYDAWVNVFVGVVLFALFGMTKEARERYKRAIRRVRSMIGWSGKRRGDGMEEMTFEAGRVKEDADETRQEDETTLTFAVTLQGEAHPPVQGFQKHERPSDGYATDPKKSIHVSPETSRA